MTFERVCSVSELPVDEAVLAEVAGVRVTMVRDSQGHIHALADECTHGRVSLSEGEVEGCFIECWLHGSRFDMRTGEPKTPPAVTAVAVYQVRVENQDVLVSVDQAAPHSPESVSTES